MAEPAESRAGPRWARRFESPASFSQDIDPIGLTLDAPTAVEAWRRDPARTADYAFRRVLTAWRLADELLFPLEVYAHDLMGVSAGEPLEAGYTIVQRSMPERVLSILIASGPGSIASAGVDRLIIKKLSGATHVAVFVDSGDWPVPIDGGHDMTGGLDAGGSAVDLVTPSEARLNAGSGQERYVWLATAYETDYAGWIFDQADRLRMAAVPGLDLANVAEELEDLGRSEKFAVQSHLGNLLMHLLKWMYQPERRSGSWRGTIRNSRRQIARKLSNSPSLRQHLAEWFSEEYGPARDSASDETELALETFPEKPPFTLEQALDPDFLPETPARDEE